jgi:hypothetical protein
MLTVLGGLAEFERELIRARTGRAAPAPWHGVRLGRKPTLTHHQHLEAIKRLKAGDAGRDCSLLQRETLDFQEPLLRLSIRKRPHEEPDEKSDEADREYAGHGMISLICEWLAAFRRIGRVRCKRYW